VAQFEEHRKPEPAGDDGHTDREGDPGVVDEPDQVVAVERETRVIECRDRVEHPVPQGLPQRVVVAGPESPGEDDCERRLEQEHGHRHAAYDVAHVADVQRVRLGLCYQRRLEPETATHEEAEKRCQGHDPEAANLDQTHDDDLAESGPMRRRVHGGQPGHAHRRDAGEGGGQHLGPAGPGRRDRQGEQHRPDEDGRQEGDRYDPGGVRSRSSHTAHAQPLPIEPAKSRSQ
jgi:hypothetical protein